jgi:hypothetical protein
LRLLKACPESSELSVILGSFAAITLCITSQQLLLLCVVSAVCDFLMADLKEQHTCITVCFKLGISA